MEFSRQEYWSGLPFPSPGDLPDPGIEPRSPALQADSLPTKAPGNLGFHKENFVTPCFRIISTLSTTPEYLWRRQWHPTPVLLPGKFHGWRSLVGCSPWGRYSQARLSDFTFTFHFHALAKEMATHSSVLAWRIPGTGEPGGLPSMGSHRVGHD